MAPGLCTPTLRAIDRTYSRVSAGRGRRRGIVVAPSPRPKKAGLTYRKEEVFVVEAQPGSVSAVASLESLDVVDKLPESVVTPLVFTMER